MDLFRPRRQFLFRTAIDDRHFGTEAQGRAGRIHRHVSAAHHGDAPADKDRRIARRVERAHQVAARQELVGGENPVQALARNAHEPGQAGTGADEDRLETLAVEQFVDGNRTAHHYVGLDRHAESADAVDFRLHHPFLRKTELRNAVLQHAARLVEHFKNRHGITQFRQVAGAGQSGRTAAHDGHLDAVGRGLLNRHAAVRTAPVGHEPFQFADGHRLAFHAQHTAAFALRLLRTHAAADGRQRTVARNRAGRFGEFASLHLRDKQRNPDSHRTLLHASRIAAVQATGGFQYRLRFIIAITYFLEIAGPDLRVLFPDGNPV